MLKLKITMGTTYCGCPSEKIEYDYNGTREEFDMDDAASTEILNMIFNGDFPHYFLEIDTEEVADDE